MAGTTKIRARADAEGIVHLDLSAAPPNGEVEVEIRMRPVLAHPPAPQTAYSWDRGFFESVLGDRVPRKRRETPAQRPGSSK